MRDNNNQTNQNNFFLSFFNNIVYFFQNYFNYRAVENSNNPYKRKREVDNSENERNSKKPETDLKIDNTFGLLKEIPSNFSNKDKEGKEEISGVGDEGEDSLNHWQEEEEMAKNTLQDKETQTETKKDEIASLMQKMGECLKDGNFNFQMSLSSNSGEKRKEEIVPEPEMQIPADNTLPPEYRKRLAIFLKENSDKLPANGAYLLRIGDLAEHIILPIVKPAETTQEPERNMPRTRSRAQSDSAEKIRLPGTKEEDNCKFAVIKYDYKAKRFVFPNSESNDSNKNSSNNFLHRKPFEKDPKMKMADRYLRKRRTIKGETNENDDKSLIEFFFDKKTYENFVKGKNSFPPIHYWSDNPYQGLNYIKGKTDINSFFDKLDKQQKEGISTNDLINKINEGKFTSIFKLKPSTVNEMKDNLFFTIEEFINKFCPSQEQTQTSTLFSNNNNQQSVDIETHEEKEFGLTRKYPGHN